MRKRLCRHPPRSHFTLFIQLVGLIIRSRGSGASPLYPPDRYNYRRLRARHQYFAKSLYYKPLHAYPKQLARVGQP